MTRSAFLVTIAAFFAALKARAQSTGYRLAVIVSSGSGDAQLVQGALADNVFLDMSTSPPTIRALRPTIGVVLSRQADSTWAASETHAAGAVVVYRNGLRQQPGIDYIPSTKSTLRLSPTLQWNTSDLVVADIYH